MAHSLVVLGMWDLPGPGIEPKSLALVGGFSTTGTPGIPTDSQLLAQPSSSEHTLAARKGREYLSLLK